MRRIFLVSVAVVIGFLYGRAQTNTLLQQINAVKTQNDVYYWDQYTGLDPDTAKLNATKRLLLHINLNRLDDEMLSVDNVMPHISYVSIDRGKKKQCFAYIEKVKADAMGKETPSTPVVVTPPTPVIADNTPKATISAIEQQPTKKHFVADAFVQRIYQTKMFSDVYKLLKSLKAQGDILQFGKLKDVEDYSSLDLILFDMQSQEIVTMLSPATSYGIRTNLINGAEDSLDNYPANMTAVIWYIRNKN